MGARRVDISFDRERRVIRAFADAVARVGRKPVPVAIDAAPKTAPAIEDADAARAEASVTDTGPSELERFAYELQERARQQTRDRVERRANDRHGTTRGNAASVVLPEPGTATVDRGATPRRRTSDRVGVGWQSAPRGTGVDPVAESTAQASASSVPARAPAEFVAAAASVASPDVGRPRDAVPRTPATTPDGVPASGTAAAPFASTAPTASTTAPAGAPEANARTARYLGALVAAYGPLDADDEAIDAPLVDVLVLDASALVALARGNVRARAHLSRAVGALARIVIPATALVDAAHARVANAIADVTQVDASIAKAAARLIADTGTNAPSTALAIALAARGDRAAVLTADVATATAYARAAGTTRPYVLAV